MAPKKCMKKPAAAKSAGETLEIVPFTGDGDPDGSNSKTVSDKPHNQKTPPALKAFLSGQQRDWGKNQVQSLHSSVRNSHVMYVVM